MEATAELAARSSIFAWRIPWLQEPGGLQITGSHRLGHDWMPEHGGDNTDLNVGNVRLLPYCCSALASREESILIHTVSHKHKFFVLWDLKWY